MATECEKYCDQKRLNPGKVAELDWQDSYKLDKLIILQAPVLANAGRNIFGGVNVETLQNALKVQRRTSIDSRNR